MSLVVLMLKHQVQLHDQISRRHQNIAHAIYQLIEVIGKWSPFNIFKCYIIRLDYAVFGTTFDSHVTNSHSTVH